MAATTHEEIEQQIKDMQAMRHGGKQVGPEGVAFGVVAETDLYGESNKYAGYVTSIAANEQEEDDDDFTSLAPSKLSYTAPQSILNEAGKGNDVDPFAAHKRPTIADREDEYHRKLRSMIISPARLDPFADGDYEQAYMFIHCLSASKPMGFNRLSQFDAFHVSYYHGILTRYLAFQAI